MLFKPAGHALVSLTGMQSGEFPQSIPRQARLRVIVSPSTAFQYNSRTRILAPDVQGNHSDGAASQHELLRSYYSLQGKFPMPQKSLLC